MLTVTVPLAPPWVRKTTPNVSTVVEAVPTPDQASGEADGSGKVDVAAAGGDVAGDVRLAGADGQAGEERKCCRGQGHRAAGTQGQTFRELRQGSESPVAAVVDGQGPAAAVGGDATEDVVLGAIQGDVAGGAAGGQADGAGAGLEEEATARLSDVGTACAAARERQGAAAQLDPIEQQVAGFRHGDGGAAHRGERERAEGVGAVPGHRRSDQRCHPRRPSGLRGF